MEGCILHVLALRRIWVCVGNLHRCIIAWYVGLRMLKPHEPLPYPYLPPTTAMHTLRVRSLLVLALAFP